MRRGSPALHIRDPHTHDSFWAERQLWFTLDMVSLRCLAICLASQLIDTAIERSYCMWFDVLRARSTRRPVGTYSCEHSRLGEVRLDVPSFEDNVTS